MASDRPGLFRQRNFGATLDGPKPTTNVGANLQRSYRMIPLHRPLSPDHRTYLLALIEWDRALDLAAACHASGPDDERRVGRMLYPALVAVARAGERLTIKERRSIQDAMASAGANRERRPQLRAA